MNTAVYIMPNLECESYAALAFNCMFNSGVWQNGDHYVHKRDAFNTSLLPN